MSTTFFKSRVSCSTVLTGRRFSISIYCCCCYYYWRRSMMSFAIIIIWCCFEFWIRTTCCGGGGGRAVVALIVPLLSVSLPGSVISLCFASFGESSSLFCGLSDLIEGSMSRETTLAYGLSIEGRLCIPSSRYSKESLALLSAVGGGGNILGSSILLGFLPATKDH